VGFWDFVASIVGSVAWPAAVFGSVLLFRKELIPLLPLLTVKHKDTELSFRLDQAEKEAAQLPAPPPDAVPLPPPPGEPDKGSLLAELDPRAAMMEARSELEQALRETAVRFGLDQPLTRSIVFITKELRRQLPPSLGPLIEDLRAIGTNAAHNRDATPVTTHDAKSFRQLTDKAIVALHAAKPPQKDIA
jgi:hypothetical protein